MLESLAGTTVKSQHPLDAQLRLRSMVKARQSNQLTSLEARLLQHWARVTSSQEDVIPFVREHALPEDKLVFTRNSQPAVTQKISELWQWLQANFLHNDTGIIQMLFRYALKEKSVETWNFLLENAVFKPQKDIKVLKDMLARDQQGISNRASFIQDFESRAREQSTLAGGGGESKGSMPENKENKSSINKLNAFITLMKKGDVDRMNIAGPKLHAEQGNLTKDDKKLLSAWAILLGMLSM